MQVLVLYAQRLRRRQRRGRGVAAARREVVRERRLALHLLARAAWRVRRAADELLVDVLGAEDGHLGEEQLARDHLRLGVVEHGPHGHL